MGVGVVPNGGQDACPAEGEAIERSRREGHEGNDRLRDLDAEHEAAAQAVIRRLGEVHADVAREMVAAVPRAHARPTPGPTPPSAPMPATAPISAAPVADPAPQPMANVPWVALAGGAAAGGAQLPPPPGCVAPPPGYPPYPFPPPPYYPYPQYPCFAPQPYGYPPYPYPCPYPYPPLQSNAQPQAPSSQPAPKPAPATAASAPSSAAAVVSPAGSGAPSTVAAENLAGPLPSVTSPQKETPPSKAEIASGSVASFMPPTSRISDKAHMHPHVRSACRCFLVWEGMSGMPGLADVGVLRRCRWCSGPGFLAVAPHPLTQRPCNFPTRPPANRV